MNRFAAALVARSNFLTCAVWNVHAQRFAFGCQLTD